MKRRIRKFSQPVKTLIISTGLALVVGLGASTALASDCRQSVREGSSDSAEGRSWFEFIRDNLPVWISRLRPAYHDADFSVRIASRGDQNNLRSPRELLDTTVATAHRLKRAFEDLGFTFPRHIQMIVDAHRGSTWRLSANTSGSVLTSLPLSDRGPMVSTLACAFEIPGFFVSRKSLRPWSAGSGENPRETIYMGLPFLTAKVHTLDHEFSITHEFAHATEPPNSHRSTVWVEGRADFLTYLVTGRTHLLWPHELRQTIVSSTGRREHINSVGVRSLSHPYVRQLHLLMPDLNLSHANSELVSNVLYLIDVTLGRQRSLELVHWMDRLPEDRALPLLARKAWLEVSEYRPRKDNQYVDTSRISVVRQALKNEMLKIAALFREWGNSAQLSREELQQLERILRDAEL